MALGDKKGFFFFFLIVMPVVKQRTDKGCPED